MDGWVKVEGVVSGVKLYILLQVIISPKTCHLFEGCWSVIDIYSYFLKLTGIEYINKLKYKVTLYI
jgi:hypothetical protein